MRRFFAGLLGFGFPISIAFFGLDVAQCGWVAPYWWLLGPVLWLGAGVAYGCLRARLSPVLAVLAAIPVVFLLFLFAAPSIYHWDGAYKPARFTFRVVDMDERPLPDVEFVVHGPTSEWGTWFDEDSRGFFPIYEYGGRPLRTDARGRLIVRQVPISLSGDGYTMFGFHFPTSEDLPRHTLEFRRAGYRPRALALKSLQERVRGSQERIAEVDVRVVLQPSR